MFDSSAAALTAKGQSIIVGNVPARLGTMKEVVSSVCDLAAAFAAEWAPCLAQQSCDCIEAHASPVTTAGGVTDDDTTAEAAALTIPPQPSMQPAPAIHKATASASDTRTTFIEEKNLIVLSLD